MNSPSTDGIREHVALMDISSVARGVMTVLGPALVGALTGTGDRALPGQWTRPYGAEPGAAAAERLRNALVQWLRLCAVEDADLARAWILGTNPLLDGGTAISALREDRFEQLDAAVTHFVDGLG
ncbi:hypothetical protein [Paeniglutamicibacter cryotolerans]|uniref:Antitoxin Xre/MbcA/ParS-like toxin-binding domain-containing protein n=1 Tax=Paeniglutamicibacter cryotolerans TaxID=670079 RepID=A0A839QNH9_9MICC|nr:hypothetical protein [Paeniglutamicibacter cryotolerans]MBB2995556.1 hypothetical protein [Paeniglutamicibacter cryotolerans]